MGKAGEAYQVYQEALQFAAGQCRFTLQPGCGFD